MGKRDIKPKIKSNVEKGLICLYYCKKETTHFFRFYENLSFIGVLLFLSFLFSVYQNYNKKVIIIIFCFDHLIYIFKSI